MQIHNAALQAQLTDKPLGKLTEVNSLIHAKPLATTGKIGVKRKKNKQTIEPAWKATLKLERKEIRCDLKKTK